MRALSLIYVYLLVGFRFCQGADPLFFDISSPDPSLAREYESTVDGVVYQSFFSTGLFFSKVVDGGVTLWEAKGEERCDVLFSSVGDGKSRAVLHVLAKGIPSRMLHYEKLDREWKLVTVRVKGVPESEEPVSPKEHAAELDFANLGCPLGGCSGSEAKPKVTLPPTESNNNGEDASENKVEGGTPDDEEESGESQPKEVDKEEPDQKSGDNAVEPVESESNPVIVDEERPKPQVPTESNEKEPEVSNESKESKPEVPELATEHIVKESEPVTKDEEESPRDSEKRSEDVQPEENEHVPTHDKELSKENLRGGTDTSQLPSQSASLEPEEPVIPFLDKIDTSLFNVEETEEGDVKVLKLAAKPSVKTTNLKYGEETVWEDNKKSCSSALLYLDGERLTLAVIKTKGRRSESTVYRHHDGKKWKKGNEGTHKNKLKELIDAAKKESPEAVKKEQGVPSAQQGQAQAKPVDKPVEAPSTQSAGNSSSLQSSNQDTFDLATQNSSSYRSSDVNINGVPAKVYVSTSGNAIKKVTNGKDVVWTATSKQTCLYCMAFQKDNNLNMAVVKIREDKNTKYLLIECSKGKWEVVTGYPIHTKVNALKKTADKITKFSLDISLAESNDNCTVENSEGSGIKTRIYAPKSGNAIDKVMDGNKVIGELHESYRCYLCELYSKGNISLLRVHTEAVVYDAYLCNYMNDGSGWTMIKEEKEFEKKLEELRSGALQQASTESSDPTSSVTPPSEGSDKSKEA
ncbi:hypothetical protein BEWA_027030 [Theileria equi strain WA]|uniref:Signal peptide containing protein n=1 Tax=Theileria equi strain WA TaxID=1537102 RepID=L0AY75_THEEQ|nr:hypothetical protein BEWA_027030 [Theileria equi strain WA]AFZ79854.1 hypothetical protein BEWA_027030 [Theileria equi strain WA]|eukprot:XP_004829520.1 hypothetical protein BEWA_027030 [Theileria equi strain WA]